MSLNCHITRWKYWFSRISQSACVNCISFMLKLHTCGEKKFPVALPEGYPAMFSKLYIIVAACCKVMTVDNLSYYNCRADFFGFISSNTHTYYDSGAGFKIVDCRRLRMVQFIYIYRVSQEERTKLWEGVPYVKLYRYNPKHLCPK